MDIVQEAEDTLKTLLASSQGKKAVSVELSLATLYQLRGDIKLSEQKVDEALVDIKEALAIRQKYLGDHLLTARTYNSLGSALQEKAVLDPGFVPLQIHSVKKEAMDCYRKALDICQMTAGEGRLHVEEPTFLMNMGEEDIMPIGKQ